MSGPRAAFIEAAIGHGTLERAESILAAHPTPLRHGLFYLGEPTPPCHRFAIGAKPSDGSPTVVVQPAVSVSGTVYSRWELIPKQP